MTFNAFVQHNISHYHSNILKFKKIKICLIKNNINPVKNRINKVTNTKTLPKNQEEKKKIENLTIDLTAKNNSIKLKERQEDTKLYFT